MDVSIFLFLLFTLQSLYWIIGRRASRQVNDNNDYFLAGKSVQLFPLMMTFLATMVGGGLVLGAAEESFLFGWPVLLYPLGNSIGLILLGTGVGRKLAQFNVSTVSQIFEVVYGSSMLKKIASVLSVVSLFMLLVGQIIGSQKFLLSMGINNIPLFILFWGIIIIYTAQGGLKAVISTDLAQASLFSIIFIICFAVVFLMEPQVDSLPAMQWESFSNVSPKLCGWILLPMLFTVLGQDMGQRCFAGASQKIVSKAAFFAGICGMFICMIPVFLGTLANTMELEPAKGSSVLMAVVAKTTNPWLTALMGCAVLAAVVSTATSLITAISSNLLGDFQFKTLEGVGSFKWVQIITCSISIVAVFFAFYFDNIVDLFMMSYELSISCLAVPLFVALFKKEGCLLGAFLAVLFGATGFIIFNFYPIDFPKEIAAILLSCLGYACGNLVSLASTRITHNI